MPVGDAISEVGPRTGRLAPAFRIRLNGQDLAERRVKGRIRSVLLVDDDLLLPYLRICLGVRTSEFGDALFTEGERIDIGIGYDLSPEVAIVERGPFFLEEPQFRRPKGASGTVVHLHAYGEAIKLARNERQRSFEAVTDSDIARRIAEEYRLKAEIQETKLRYPRVVQSETDWNLLLARAAIHGFTVFVRNGTLHFHAIKTIDSGITFSEGRQGEFPIYSFTGQISHYRMAPKLSAAVLDPLTGVLTRVTATGAPPEERPRRKTRFTDPPPRQAEAITGAPQRFLVDAWHRMDNDAVTTTVEAVQDSMRYVVRVRFEAKAHEQLQVGELFHINGLGQFQGAYYAQSVTHRIRGGTYVTVVEGRRTFSAALSEDAMRQTIFNPLEATSGGGVRRPGQPALRAGPVTGAFDARTGRVVEFARSAEQD